MISSSALTIAAARTILKRYVWTGLSTFAAVLRRLKNPNSTPPLENVSSIGCRRTMRVLPVGTSLRRDRRVTDPAAKPYSTQALTQYDGNGTTVDDLAAIGYDPGCLADECIVNIYLDTEQSKIEERANFIGFLEELTRSGGVNDDVKRKIQVFLDSKRYEAVVETQL